MFDICQKDITELLFSVCRQWSQYYSTNKYMTKKKKGCSLLINAHLYYVLYIFQAKRKPWSHAARNTTTKQLFTTVSLMPHWLSCLKNRSLIFFLSVLSNDACVWETRLPCYFQFSNTQSCTLEISMEHCTHISPNFLQPLNCQSSDYISSNNIATWLISIKHIALWCQNSQSHPTWLNFDYLRIQSSNVLFFKK